MGRDSDPPIERPITVDCPDCHGSGKVTKNGKLVDCGSCFGKGVQKYWWH